MKPRKRLAVVLNPIAGQGRGRRRLDRTLDLLRRDASVEVYATARPGEGIEATRAACAKGADAVIAAGGDGTINEVVNGLAGTGVPLGVVPLGTANVMAAELGIPRDPRRLAELIARGPIRDVWVGRAGDRRFAVMASAGFDADVVRDVDPGLKQRLGKGAFVLAFVAELVRFSPKRLTVRAGGQTCTASQVLVAKAAKYGGDFVAAPMASVDRPEFCIYAINAPTRCSILRLAVALARGRLSSHPAVRTLYAAEVSLAGDQDTVLQADGEVIGCLPVRIAIDSRQVPIIAPEPASAAVGHGRA
jgi:YegS/Rv2252/BmrU family lipid kinase